MPGERCVGDVSLRCCVLALRTSGTKVESNQSGRATDSGFAFFTLHSVPRLHRVQHVMNSTLPGPSGLYMGLSLNRRPVLRSTLQPFRQS